MVFGVWGEVGGKGEGVPSRDNGLANTKAGECQPVQRKGQSVGYLELSGMEQEMQHNREVLIGF